MRRSMRMLMMNGGNDDQGGRRDDNGRSRSDREYGMDSGYGIESRFRDDRGREHYDDGRYAPMNELDMRAGGRRSRDSSGRYTSPQNNYGYMRGNGDGGEMHYPSSPPYGPPIYDGERRRRGEEYKPMNKIGFSLDGEMGRADEFHKDYRPREDYPRIDEIHYRKGGERISGYGMGDAYMPFDKEMAEDWTQHMENEDGSIGPHWTISKTKEVQAQRGIECDPLEFFVAMNAMYSDYCKAAKKLGVNTVDFYAEMAKAFLDDEDAVDDKLAAYYTYVVKH